MLSPKSFTKEYFQATYKDNEGITFNVPCPAIRDPREIIVTAALYNPPVLGCVTGTVCNLIPNWTDHVAKLYLYSSSYHNSEGMIVEVNKRTYRAYHHIKTEQEITQLPGYLRVPQFIDAIHKIIDTSGTNN